MSPAKKGSGETTTCPWCSATVPVEATTCPSCGASLRDAAEGDIPGVTQLDPAAVIRTPSSTTARCTPAGRAPSATRIPNSRARRSTDCATTP